MYIYIWGNLLTLSSKATYNHSCTHSHTDGGVNHTRQRPVRREPSGWGALLRDTQPGGAGDRTINLPVTSQPALPPELLPPFHNMRKKNDKTSKLSKSSNIDIQRLRATKIHDQFPPPSPSPPETPSASLQDNGLISYCRSNTEQGHGPWLWWLWLIFTSAHNTGTPLFTQPPIQRYTTLNGQDCAPENGHGTGRQAQQWVTHKTTQGRQNGETKREAANNGVINNSVAIISNELSNWLLFPSL